MVQWQIRPPTFTRPSHRFLMHTATGHCVYILTLSRRSYSRIQHRDVCTVVHTYLRFLWFVFIFSRQTRGRWLALVFILVIHLTVSGRPPDYSILDAKFRVLKPSAVCYLPWVNPSPKRAAAPCFQVGTCQSTCCGCYNDSLSAQQDPPCLCRA